MSDSVRPHRRQPTRLPHPWDSPGKNTGVGCHFLLQCMKAKSESEVAQSCPTLRDPMDCSLPGSSVHGIFQARVLEWGVSLSYPWLPYLSSSLLPSSLFLISCAPNISSLSCYHRVSLSNLNLTVSLLCLKSFNGFSFFRLKTKILYISNYIHSLLTSIYFSSTIFYP